VEIEELVSRAQHGDPEAFGQLYDVLVDRVYRYVRSRVSNLADAEDLTQRVFMKAIEALPRYEPRGLPFAAWIFRIARNVVIDAGRMTRDHAPLDDAMTLLSNDPGPAELALAGDDRATITRALAGLTSDQRDVISYRFFGDLSVAEIAAVLGKSQGAVRVLQFRGLAALRRRLAIPRDAEAGSGEEAP
jgi:RNA polymerase sigma-70 factor (ECF subfamily)